jgi:hypothetical protein
MQGLSFHQFETLGKRILEEIGSRNAVVSGRAGDQGIDLHGNLTIGGLTGEDLKVSHLMHSLVFQLVGQAKHYPRNAISTAQVREFIGSVVLARHQLFSQPNIDPYGLRSFAPVVMLLLSTGRFTRGAELLAERAGIVARSGTQLAVFLADRGAGFRPKRGKTVFSKEAFLQWLSIASE